MNNIIEKNEMENATINNVPEIDVKSLNEDFIIGNVDSKTKGFERYADCFDKSFGPNKNPIKINIIENKIYRI